MCTFHAYLKNDSDKYNNGLAQAFSQTTGITFFSYTSKLMNFKASNPLMSSTSKVFLLETPEILLSTFAQVRLKAEANTHPLFAVTMRKTYQCKFDSLDMFLNWLNSSSLGQRLC